MPDGYGTHADYIGRIDEEIRNRQRDVEAALKHAFSGFLETRSVDVIVFSNVGVMDLANAVHSHFVIPERTNRNGRPHLFTQLK